MATRKIVLLVVIACTVLLIGPLLVRIFVFNYTSRSYAPQVLDSPSIAATPEPTVTPFAVDWSSGAETADLPPGPVLIDYAHFNQIVPSNLQTLASQLARRGIASQAWISEVDPFMLESFGDFPDQSQKLADLLSGASGLIVISPFFLWTPQEIAVVERFVDDGGRLLLISDPDVFGDSAAVMNLLAEPFGVVINEDYLYDTIDNDQNYTHFFQGEFLDQAASLSGARVAFYGGRSIAGNVDVQVRSANSTLSSMGTGVTGFTTAAIGAAGRVLALSDFDVFAEPNAVRHDNHRIVEFTADFLAGGKRINTVADFPAYLDKQVTLTYGMGDALDADLLLLGARLQRKLEENGRVLRLNSGVTLTSTAKVTGVVTGVITGVLTDTATISPVVTDSASLAMIAISEATPITDSNVLTDQLAISTAATGTLTVTTVTEVTGTVGLTNTAEAAVSLPQRRADTIYLGVYETAAATTDLLSSVGVEYVTEYITPTVQPDQQQDDSEQDAQEDKGDGESDGDRPTEQTPTPTPHSTQSPLSQAITATLAPTATATATATPATPARPTPTPTATGEEESDEGGSGATDAPGQRRNDARSTPTATAGATITSTATPTASPTPTSTPTPVKVTYLVTQNGLRLLADESALVIQRIAASGSRIVAVLGTDATGISDGVERLLTNDFDDCIIDAEVTVCPVKAGQQSPTPTARQSQQSDSGGAEHQPGEATATPAASDKILLVDDNRRAQEGELSEADAYLMILTGAGQSPDLWTTADKGNPSADDMQPYRWVIWSNAGYSESELDISYVDQIFQYLNGGGRLTVSSLKPFFGMGIEPPSTIKDLVVDDDVPALVEGLPDGSITLTGETRPVAPLAQPQAEDTFQVSLRRGPASDNADSPAMIVATDEGQPESVDARLVVIGMSITWLPVDVRSQLVLNMAEWMTEGN
jgi:hypothetical protein